MGIRGVSFGIEEVDFFEIGRIRGPPVDHGKREVGSRILNWSPDVDDLVPAFQQLLCLVRWKMPTDTHLRSTRSLVDVDWLDWLSGCVLDSAADGVVENDNLFDARQPPFEHALYFPIVPLTDGFLVREAFLGCGFVVDCRLRSY